jgi:hypothetical protein
MRAKAASRGLISRPAVSAADVFLVPADERGLPVQIVDRKTIPWFIGTLAVYAASTVGYIVYVRASPRGAHGGSIPGLIYAIAGSALILFALVLNVRKRLFRTARLGRAYTWMQAHIWLGTLSYPIIIYHAGFKWGGPLTQVLMWTFTFVILTGILGLALQQFMPGMIKRDVPRETVIGQIEHVMDRLRAEADAVVSSAERGAVELDVDSPRELVAAETPAGGVAVATATATVGVELTRQRLLLRSFYDQQVVPLLDRKTTPRLTHSKWEKFNARFGGVRTEFPQSLHETMDDLLSIVRERAQLETQKRLHRILHCWLLVHIPLSYVMIVLGVIHGVYAWRYAPIGGW